MAKRKFKYIYGPVSSWRLGRSLGIDVICRGKDRVCSFDCIYCQAGKTRILSDRRKVFAPTREIIEEIKTLPPLKFDYITFSGAGEPTLAKNLGEIIKEIRKIRKAKIAVLTNSSIIDRKDVQRDLRLADFVIAKLDAHNHSLFTKINKPVKKIKFDNIVKGLKEFKSRYKGKFALQIMFVKENKRYAREIAHLACGIKPDEIQINTPLRPCEVTPLPKKELDKIEGFFKGITYVSVYKTGRKACCMT
ncbi:MAG: radical SAM protein [Candidatus Omnitrophota bacterium]|nr:MAG: radical SAM protein [Candidatus Omnitrophota bacterium]